MVVSACGRRFKGDTKVTDLLYLVNAHVKYHVSCEELLEDIGQRYFDIADELELAYPIREEFAAFAERARSGGYSTEELVSRGEYFTARLMAEYLGLPFLDAATVVAFHHDGTLSMNRTSELVQEYGQQGGFVMPGFYGATREGQIKLLDRGGGDISGSILAKCLGADLYENWTDVSGFYSADPRIVPEAQPIARVTYEELRELSYMGASVLHEEAVFPVREAGIPLVIKNTNAPQDPGTIISETADEGEAEPIITGVTGKRGFVAINVARDRTKPRVGFMRRALSVFERYDVSVEHMPTGVDRFGAVVQEQDVHDSLYSLVGDIQQEVEPLEIEVVEGLALIATVGRNLRGRAGISGHLFGMLGQAGVSVRMISQSCDEINIIIGVEEKDFDLAIRTIYRAFSDENGIVKVSAKDLGTGKEQQISITASTNLSKEDIDKAVHEAEQYAAEDKARKDEVDAHNAADQVAYQTEKTLGELGDKISADEKAKIQSAVDHLKEVNKGTDVEAIKAATDEVQKAFYAVSEKLYQQAGPQGQAGGPQAGAQGGNKPGDDGVVDADYETVD